jgi:hypothetical protein
MRKVGLRTDAPNRYARSVSLRFCELFQMVAFDAVLAEYLSPQPGILVFREFSFKLGQTRASSLVSNLTFGRFEA